MEAVAVDFDRTLVAEDVVLRARTRAALGRARAAGIHVVVVTGRMFRSIAPYLRDGGLDGPVVCYQGAVVADADGTFLRHVPIPLELAREAVAAVVAEGAHLNAYVGDELYVAEVTPEARAYADFQHIPLHPVGDLRTWLRAPPTKLVAVGERDAMDELERRLRQRFAGRLYVSKSLPEFVELASPEVNKATGLEFVARRLGFARERTVAFGDGENDVELVEWAGYGVAVANAHDRVLAAADLVCPPDEEEGVAQVLEAYLDSRP
ncbi:MAG TPA: HAD family hydrolase [Gaiellaceae bacterium]|nr:HAD family hydrolase [Gaiellaceae bacterium]